MLKDRSPLQHSSPPFLSTLQAVAGWLQGAQSAEHSRLLPSHQLTRGDHGAASHTTHYPYIVPCYGDTGAGAGSTLYCHYVSIVIM